MGTIKTESKVQYICMLVRGEALHQFDLLYVDVENKNSSLDVDYLLNGLAWYFLPVNSLSKKKRAMHCCMKRLCSLNVKLYAARLIDLNDYLDSFPGATMTDQIGM